MGRKVGGSVVPLPVEAGELGRHLTQCGLPGPRPTSIPIVILIHPAIWPHVGRKLSGEEAVPLSGGEMLGPIQPDVAWAEAYVRTKWHLDPSSRLSTIDMDQKLGSCCAPLGGWKLSSHLTMQNGPRPTSVPSCIWIRADVCPQ